jgi:hypothetical protein
MVVGFTTTCVICVYHHLSSPPVFSGFRVTPSLVLYVCFVDRCLFFCIFPFGHCVVYFFDIWILIAPLVSSNSSCELYNPAGRKCNQYNIM